MASVSKSDILRGIITEKLSAAAREILAVVERTVADYEDEAAGFRQEVDRQRRLLELLQPEIKLEADDQQVCEAGGGQLPEDQEQQKYGLSLEDSESLGYLAPVEEDDCQYLEQEEEHMTELDYAVPSRPFPQKVQTRKRRRGRWASSDPTLLSIRILENSKIKVISNDVCKKYPTQKLKVPEGLREAEFLDLLKSTFPQLANEPFSFFFCLKNRKLKPLKVNSLTPEEIESFYGNSIVYIRLQREEDPPSIPDTISQNTRVTADETKPTSHPLTETDTHINLNSHVLEDPQMDMISPIDLEDSESLGYLAPIEEDDCQYLEQEEEHLKELDYAMPSRPFPQKVQTKSRRKSRRPSSDPIHLSIRILESSKIKVTSTLVYRNSPVQKLKVPHGLQEAEFLELLKSFFPQLADEPFKFFICGKHRRLKPLIVKSVTPEEINRVYGNSTLFIRLQREDPDEEPDEEPDEDPPSTPDTISHNTRVTGDETTPNSHPLTELDNAMPSRTKTVSKGRYPSSDPTLLNICILENSKIPISSHYVYRNFPVQKLKVPRGLQEADFLELLKSFFPQLADEPFKFFFRGKHRRLKPLILLSVTPEEINRLHGNCIIYIRLLREDADEDPDDPPSTPDTVSHNARVTADETTPTSRVLAETDTHINLKIYILEYPQLISSPIVFQNCPPHKLQVPRGLQEADFLALLRSTFTQLAEGFTILTAHSKKLNALKVESVTAEEIYRTSRPIGDPVIFIQLKGPLREAGAGDPTPDGTTPNTDDTGLVRNYQNTCSGEPNGMLKSEAGFLNQLFQITDTIKPLDEDLRCIILRVLPAISEDTQQALVDKLLSNGLESTQDLKYVTQEDIGDLLPALQLQNLLEAFKNEDCGQASLLRKHWTETFKVPWKLMPMEVQAAVAEGQRPSREARREMARILVDEIRTYDLNPSRSECIVICQKVIQRYPQSFADLDEDGQLMKNSYTSLLGQVMYQNEKLNRTLKIIPHRSSALRRSTHTYDCTTFKPRLPPVDTDETVQRKRQRVEEISCQDGENMAEKDELTELMKATFSLQRRQINALPAPAVRDLRGRWPHLFTQNGLYTHFELLTDIKVLRNLEVAMEECGRAILELFSESTNPDVQTVLSLGPNYELSFCVIQLLMAHFAEDLEGLILFADAPATAAEVEEALQLPASPRLILLAESPGSFIHRWMISLEGNVICEGIQPTFLSGLAAVFSTYYIFNLQYQDDAACTLEFIQRRFIGINPDRGTKGKLLSEQTGEFTKEKTTPINPQVLTLLNKLMDVNLRAYTDTATFPSL